MRHMVAGLTLCVVAQFAMAQEAPLMSNSSLTVNEARKAPSDKYFYVYADKGDKRNHFIPSGWMGDFGDLKLDEANTEDPADGKTAIKWTYNAKGAQGANWAGVYWQAPANNWGEKPGGYDLSGFKKLTFWAKSDQPVKIATFKVGGITGEHGDSDAIEIGPTDITPKWTKYTIELKGANLYHIIGGFCFSASRDDNPNGFRLYLDEIRFER